MLSRPTGSTIAVKMRLEPTRRATEQRVYPGHDWFFVIEERVRLSLGERDITVETGEAAEFATMTPHAFAAIDGPSGAVAAMSTIERTGFVTWKPIRSMTSVGGSSARWTTTASSRMVNPAGTVRWTRGGSNSPMPWTARAVS